MSRSRTSGFTLVEMAITILVMGMLIAFSIPAFTNISATYQLKGATENLAAQFRIAREKAMANQMEQPIHIAPGSLSVDYHVHYPSGFIPTWGKWKLPRGITFHSYTSVLPTMLKDGRINGSGEVILRDARGNRDTVSYLSSGLILTK
jgi:prepilin-type N-terminal cleavage/methylation domain-containing protein